MILIRHKDSAEVLLSVSGDTLRGATLIDAQLAGANLAGLDLSHAVLRNANLQGAALDKAELIGAVLDGCDLSRATLVEANLTDASLQHARLRRANLNGCQMRYAHLAGADLSKASLIAADLTMADLRAEFPEAELRDANLRGANLTDANLIRANLTNADLTGATLIHATFHEAQLKGAKLNGVVRKEGVVAPESALVGKLLKAGTVEDHNGVATVQIRVECPHCTTPQRVLRSEVNNMVPCRFCEQPFFLDRAGKPHAEKTVAVMDWTPEVSKTPNTIHQDLEWKPEWTRRAISAGVGVLCLPLIWMATAWLLAWSAPPKELADRASYLGYAVARGDEARVIALTRPDDAPLAKQWLAETRAEPWDALAKQGEMRVESKVLFANMATKMARTETQVSNVSADPAASPEPPRLITSMWTLGDEDKWMLAPKFMLAEQ